MLTSKLQRIIGKTIKICFFLTAVVTGMLFAIVWRSYENTMIDVPYQVYYGHDRLSKDIRKIEIPYQDWLEKQGLRTKALPEEDIAFGKETIETEASFLSKKIKVLCLILSKGKNKAASVKETWAKRCNEVLFYGSFTDDKIPVHRYSSLEPSHTSFCKILQQVIKGNNSNETSGSNHRDYNWLLIAQDNSYVILENVRKLVAPLDYSQKYNLGRPVKQHSLPVFNSLDSVILLSRGSVEFIINKFFLNSSSCQKGSFYFENVNQTVEMSRSFEVSLSIMLDPKLFISNDETNSSSGNSILSVSDTRDNQNRSRFLPFNPQMHLIPDSISVFSPFHRHNLLPSGEGMSCCSDSAITFGQLSPARMLLMEYFLYHLTVYKNSHRGLGNQPVVDTHDKSNDDAWKNILDIGKGTVEQEHIKKKRPTRKKSLWFNF
jgi:glycoprotein-N-acetylgalactosamine 3-beta-galactosyltransferase